MNNLSFETLEYNIVLGIISLYADSQAGRICVTRLIPLPDSANISHRLALTAEAAKFISLYQGFSLSGLDGLDEIFQKRNISGAVLEIEEVARIRTNLLAAEDVSFRLAETGLELEHMGKLIDSIPKLGSLSKAINRVLDDQGQIRDDASYELLDIRQSMASLRNRVNKTLEDNLKNGRYQNAIQDDIITKRSGRFVLMLKSDFKGAMNGIIHDSSHSGQSVFIEPMEVVELNNRIAKLEQEEKLEIRRILAELSGVIFEKDKELKELTDILVELDVYQALARFMNEDGCVIPEIEEDTNEIVLKNARHPLLDERVIVKREEFLGRKTQSGRKVVPVSISLDRIKRGMVISGPNMGGKTVSLKTIGLLSLLALSGIPIPAEKFALPLLKQISVDIGDQQEITRNISTFSSHLMHIKKAIDDLQKPALILLDEMGTGTDPEEGSALARGILDYFLDRGCFIVITTHSNYLKTYSCVAERLKSAAVQYDPGTGKPTYRLIEGTPGSSKAFGIAKSLGLPQEIIDNAGSHLEAGHQYMEDFLDKLEIERIRYGEETKKTVEERSELTKEVEKVKKEKELLEDQRRSFVVKFKDEWSGLVTKYSEKVSELVASLGNKTQQLQLKRFAAERLKDLEERLYEEPVMKQARKKGAEIDLPDALPEGAKVKLKIASGVGKIARAWKKGTDKKLHIDFGGKNIEVNPEDIAEIVTVEPVSTEGTKMFAAFSLERHGKVSNEINLIGKAADEIEETLVKFIDDALLAGLGELRIVHGKGKGILRQKVAELLRNHPSVESYTMADFNRGGEGATEVKLK
jgi:DNA mismatch repair protein MutS2